MNLKKLFAAVAGVSLLAQTFVPVFGASSFGAEMDEAYAYAYDVGVTTQYPIENANMYGAMTRAEMAKMLGAWAEGVLGVKADTSKACTFSDTASVKGDLAGWIVKSCQMGLMGVGISAFRPYDTVSRAEFGTVLSRAIWGTKNDGGVPYYAAHLNALKNAGIMTMINDAENTKEVRGYVMIMLQRAHSIAIDVAKDECKDPLIILACLVDEDNCPAACKDEEKVVVEPGDRPEAKGDLAISITDKSSAVVSIPAVGIITAGTLDLKASTDDIFLYSLTVERFGLGQRSAIDRLRVEYDGVRVSSRASVNMEGVATIAFSPALIIKKGNTETVELTVRFDGETGGEHAFRIINVDSSAKNISVSPKETTTFRTTTYTVAEVEFEAKGSAATYRAGESNNFEFGAFRIDNKSSERPVLISAITFRNDGNGDLSNLKDLTIYDIDGNKISKGAPRINGKEISFSLNNYEFAPAMGGMFYLRGGVNYVDSVDGDTYQLLIRNVEDLNAKEKATGFRASLVKPSSSTAHTLAKYTVQGSDVILTKSSSHVAQQSVPAGSSEVVFAVGTLTTTQPITMEDFSLPMASFTKGATDYLA